MKSRKLIFGLILLVCILIPVLSQTINPSSTLTFNVTQDAFVKGGSFQNNNYGTDSNLRCKKGADWSTETYDILAFGADGQHKMLYDPRTRPMNVYIDGKVYIAINAGATSSTTTITVPQVLTYDLVSKTFSNTVTLGGTSSDHHDGPMIWADMNEKLHIFYD